LNDLHKMDAAYNSNGLEPAGPFLARNEELEGEAKPARKSM
jgi:hypothetical protein